MNSSVVCVIQAMEPGQAYTAKSVSEITGMSVNYVRKILNSGYNGGVLIKRHSRPATFLTKQLRLEGV